MKSKNSLLENIKKQKNMLFESSMIQTDFPMELVNKLDAADLPQFIIIGEGPKSATYKYYDCSKSSLFDLMTREKGMVGKVVYTLTDQEKLKDDSIPKQLELQIYKTVNQRKTLLSVGQILTH